MNLIIHSTEDRLCGFAREPPMGDLSRFNFNVFLPRDLPKDCLKHTHYPVIIYCKIQRMIFCDDKCFCFHQSKRKFCSKNTRTLQLSIATLHKWAHKFAHECITNTLLLNSRKFHKDFHIAALQLSTA